jgi:hypothetical protein
VEGPRGVQLKGAESIHAGQHHLVINRYRAM